jgi:hypothetical protein
MTDHTVSIMRLGAITVTELDLMETPAPTTDQVQSSLDCLGLVAFFDRAAIADDVSKVESHLDTFPLVRLFCEGLVMQHRRMVLYIGAFTDPTRSEVKWVALPDDMKKWFGGENAVQASPADMKEIEQRLTQTAWARKFNANR